MIERRIYLIRGHKVMLDDDLAELYEISTGNLNLAVRRNRARFPQDFMFQLTPAEFQNLRLQFATSRWGGRRYRPYAFTEHGVAMLSSVLKSERAVQVNILIMRAFVQLRQILATHKDLARKLEEMEKKYDAQFKVVFTAIRELMEPKPVPPSRQIGFIYKKPKDKKDTARLFNITVCDLQTVLFEFSPSPLLKRFLTCFAAIPTELNFASLDTVQEAIRFSAVPAPTAHTSHFQPLPPVGNAAGPASTLKACATSIGTTVARKAPRHHDGPDLSRVSDISGA